VKKIEAVTRPFKLDEVNKALSKLGSRRDAAADVKGFGRRVRTASGRRRRSRDLGRHADPRAP
jgi:nitrogen regulatory protein PII